MKSKTLLTLLLSVATTVFSGIAHADDKPEAFTACLNRTQHDRTDCQSGCGMILQQCYDEADDALSNHIETLLAKQRSASCSALLKKYADGSLQLTNNLLSSADSQPGWLSANLKMKLIQQRYDTAKLIDEMCK